VVTAFLNTSDAMENATATWTPLMKQTVHLVIQVNDLNTLFNKNVYLLECDLFRWKILPS
jgi:hypothetical protein